MFALYVMVKSSINQKITKLTIKQKLKMQTTVLLITLFGCHWLADYTHLSTAWMLNAKRLGKPLFPIFTHAMVHSVLMGIALWLLGINNELITRLMLFQLITHFAIDVWKGRMNGWFPSLANPTNKGHWWIFGIDQYFHAIVIIFMVHFIVGGYEI